MIRSSGFSGKTIACKDWLTHPRRAQHRRLHGGPRTGVVESLNLSAQAHDRRRGKSTAIGKDCREVFLRRALPGLTARFRGGAADIETAGADHPPAGRRR